jgi:NTE family protein
MKALKEWLYTLDKIKVFRLVDFTFGSHGLIKADRVLNEMKTFVADQQIEDLRIPYVAIATDIVNRKEVQFTNGSLYEAIRASIAIPSVITPVKTKDGVLVDGGVVNNIPINRVKRHEGDIIIAVNVNADGEVDARFVKQEEKTGSESRYLKRVKELQSSLSQRLPFHRDDEKENKLGYFDYVSRTINMMTYHIAETMIANHPVDCLVNVPRAACGTYDFYKAEYQVELGRYSAVKALDNLSL